jgi:hypothetical protein
MVWLIICLEASFTLRLELRYEQWKCGVVAMTRCLHHRVRKSSTLRLKFVRYTGNIIIEIGGILLVPTGKHKMKASVLLLHGSSPTR